VRREEHRWFSGNLGHDMDVIVYGHAGKPLICFPSYNGRVHDWEDRGMVDAVADLIENGRVIMFAVDGIDWQSWTNQNAAPNQRAQRHNDYHRYITEEVAPLTKDMSGRPTAWTTGCSMGAFHAANTFFRRPDLFDGVIAMSGVYRPDHFVGGNRAASGDGDVYFNSPISYLPNLGDPWHLDHYRRSRIVFTVGQGAFENDAIADTHAMQEILHAKGIPATFDYWGHDVEHHWYWWQKMLRHHLEPLWHWDG
jgi:esterase/lipase superfamily enzyme